MMMQNVLSGFRQMPQMLRRCVLSSLVIVCAISAGAVRADEPSAAGLWQKVEDGKPTGFDNELVDELRGSFGERGADDDPVEAGRLGRSQARRIRVVREPEDGHVRIRLCDLVGIHAREIADDEVGRIDAVRGRELVALGEQHIELASKEDIDPDQQDRRHAPNVPPPADTLKAARMVAFPRHGRRGALHGRARRGRPSGRGQGRQGR